MRFKILALAAAAMAVSSVGMVTVAEPALADASRAVPMAEEAKKRGELHKLGKQTIAGYTVSLIMYGEPDAGKEVEFDIKLIDSKDAPKPPPKALRVWIGAADAKDADKVETKKGSATYGAFVKVPSPLPDGARAWVEVETEGGKNTGSYELGDHKDHKH